MEELVKKISIVPIRDGYKFVSVFQVIERRNVSQFSTKLSKNRNLKIKKLKLPFYKHVWYE